MALSTCHHPLRGTTQSPRSHCLCLQVTDALLLLESTGSSPGKPGCQVPLAPSESPGWQGLLPLVGVGVRGGGQGHGCLYCDRLEGAQVLPLWAQGPGMECWALLKLHRCSCGLHGPCCCRWELGTALWPGSCCCLCQARRHQALWGCSSDGGQDSGVAALPTVLPRGLLCVFPDAHLQADRHE